jgi:hypothetical protein
MTQHQHLVDQLRINLETIGNITADLVKAEEAVFDTLDQLEEALEN